MTPLFSIVIPTRNRPYTLQHTLRTCVEQKHDSYEIVVSDNDGPSETRHVVESFASERIHYCRTESLLGLNDSWEYAVSKARGEYVLVLGDDDGLLPNSLVHMGWLIAETKAMALHWHRLVYSWPGYVGEEPANVLRIPLGQSLTHVNGRSLLVAVANSQIDITYLPSPYFAAVHRDLIQRVRQRCGRVFAGYSPDVFSGMALACLLDEFPSVSCPLSISGRSATSLGVANHNDPEGLDRYLSSVKESAKTGLGFHPKAPAIREMPALMADMFFHVKDHFFPNDSKLSVDRHALCRHCIEWLRSRNPAEYRYGVQALRASVADDRRLRAWLENLLISYPPDRVFDPNPPFTWGLQPNRDLHIDASQFGVENVYDAAKLCEKILAYDSHNPPRPREHHRLSYYRRLRTACRILLNGA